MSSFCPGCGVTSDENEQLNAAVGASCPFCGEGPVREEVGAFDLDAESAAQDQEFAEMKGVDLFADAPPDVPAESGNPVAVALTEATGVVALEGRCGAQTKSGESCRNKAGFKTDHLGSGRCYMHGGRAGAPVTTGRYAAVKHGSIAELMGLQEADRDYLDTEPDIRMARALFVKWVNDYEDFIVALEAWHASFQTGDGSPKPVKLPQLQDGIDYLDRITKMVERVRKAEAMNAISRPDLNRAIYAMARTVDTYVPDLKIRAQIAESWLRIEI